MEHKVKGKFVTSSRMKKEIEILSVKKILDSFAESTYV
jgi:hypothetical protein